MPRLLDENSGLFCKKKRTVRYKNLLSLLQGFSSSLSPQQPSNEPLNLQLPEVLWCNVPRSQQWHFYSLKAAWTDLWTPFVQTTPCTAVISSQAQTKAKPKCFGTKSFFDEILVFVVLLLLQNTPEICQFFLVAVISGATPTPTLFLMTSVFPYDK